MKPGTDAGGRHGKGRGYGLVIFAAFLLGVIACFNLIYGIAAVAHAHVFVAQRYPATRSEFPVRRGRHQRAGLSRSALRYL
jgi:hypothetical protein